MKKDPQLVATVKPRHRGVYYGEISNRYGDKVPVRILFMERLKLPDLSKYAKLAAALRDGKVLTHALVSTLKAVVHIAGCGVAPGHMVLNNVGMRTDGAIVLCDLGGRQQLSKKHVRNTVENVIKSYRSLLPSEAKIVPEPDEIIAGWHRDPVPPAEIQQQLFQLKVDFSGCDGGEPPSVLDARVKKKARKTLLSSSRLTACGGKKWEDQTKQNKTKQNKKRNENDMKTKLKQNWNQIEMK